MHNRKGIQIFTPSTTPPANGTTTPWVTVLPNDPDPTEWFENNPVLASFIIIGGFLLILVVIFFCWIRYRRKRWEKKNAANECSEAGESKSGSTTPKTDRKASSVSEIFGDSFVIIQTPLSKRRESKPKRTLGVPPFSFNPKPSSSGASHHNPARRATVHFARWSNEGMEIHSAGILGDRKRTASTSTTSAASERFSRSKSTGDDVVAIDEHLETNNNDDSDTSAPKSAVNPNRLVFRRVSQGHHHVIYAPQKINNKQPGQISKEI